MTSRFHLKITEPRLRVFHSKDGREHRAWRIAITTHSGKRYFRQFQTKEDALRARAELLQKGFDPGGAPSTNVKVRLSEAAKFWLDGAARGIDGRPPVEPATLRGYRQRVRTHIIPFIGDYFIDEITEADILDFRDQMLTRISRPLAKMVLTSLKALLSYAALYGLGGLKTPPGQTVRIYSSKREDKHRHASMVPLSYEEVSAMLKMADRLASDPPTQTKGKGAIRVAWRKYRIIVHLAFSTGMRSSEIRGLSWPQIDLARGTLRVTQRADMNGIVGPCKSASGYRNFVLPQYLVDMLADWRSVVIKSDENLVFPTLTGRAPTLSNMYKRCWCVVQMAAGVTKIDNKGRVVPKYGMHAARHFHISNLIAQRVNLKEVQTEAGHASIQTTIDVYGHLLDHGKEERRELAEKIAEKLTGARKK